MQIFKLAALSAADTSSTFSDSFVLSKFSDILVKLFIP